MNSQQGLTDNLGDETVAAYPATQRVCTFDLTTGKVIQSDISFNQKMAVPTQAKQIDDMNSSFVDIDELGPVNGDSHPIDIRADLNKMMMKMMQDQPFVEGTYIVEDPNGDLYNTYKRAERSYSRISSHCKQNRWQDLSEMGVDILLKNGDVVKKTVLLTPIELYNGKRALLMKPENHSCNFWNQPFDTVMHGLEFLNPPQSTQARKERIPTWLIEKFRRLLNQLRITNKEKYINDVNIWGFSAVSEFVKKAEKSRLSDDQRGKIEKFIQSINSKKCAWFQFNQPHASQQIGQEVFYNQQQWEELKNKPVSSPVMEISMTKEEMKEKGGVDLSESEDEWVDTKEANRVEVGKYNQNDSDWGWI